MPSICVFCGSSTGNDPVFAESAKELGARIAQSQSTLIYGGGKVGLMGIVADEVLNHNGKVIGIIPDFLYKKEVGHDGISKLEIVHSMHERKKRMVDLTDIFIALPGGWGTLDELAEILTWRQLGLITQPVGLLNINSFFTPLIAQFERMVNQGFVKATNHQSLVVGENVEDLLTALGVDHRLNS